MKSRRAVHFGAGNIGRGLVGLLLSQSGYEICFVARNEKQIELLQQRKQYTVTLANENRDTNVVRNVSAVHVKNDKALRQTIAEADLVTTAVGASSLPHIAESLAKGIAFRLRENKRPLNVIACENAVGGSAQLKKLVYRHLDEQSRERADRYVSFPNSIVDRIVPQQKNEDPLAVQVEPFFEWVVHRSGNMGDIGDIRGIQVVDKLEPYTERKLFTVNTGHCVAAYFGYLSGYRTIQEALKDARLRSKVEKVLHETGEMLIRKHGFNELEHRKYIRKTLERFANPALADKVIRVGRSPLRKLAPNDRLVRPALQALALGVEAPHLVSAIASALMFDYEGDPEAVRLQELIRKYGVSHALTGVTGIPEKNRLHALVAAEYGKMRQAAMRPPLGNMSTLGNMSK
ncbi:MULTISPECIES: mannitol-1-phosphate 5-dehydrogenase [Cohnella]|uniref:mannitol-1-phosphate 5-dehydrogenase n=1 Tax=Cohnella TaxID=329857 RepID=UPI0009BB9D77|nr:MULTISPECIES: mannitol-1-phosphate 5-dehydrogenase [Cohnella]MBN2981899.1 mannitol-1-phosphate 5-dehydrogenase [Cohnella algarum]